MHSSQVSNVSANIHSIYESYSNSRTDWPHLSCLRLSVQKILSTLQSHTRHFSPTLHSYLTLDLIEIMDVFILPQQKTSRLHLIVLMSQIDTHNIISSSGDRVKNSLVLGWVYFSKEIQNVVEHMLYIGLLLFCCYNHFINDRLLVWQWFMKPGINKMGTKGYGTHPMSSEEQCFPLYIFSSFSLSPHVPHVSISKSFAPDQYQLCLECREHQH